MSRIPSWGWALLPLALLGALSVAVARGGLLDFLRGGAPPVEALTFERVALRPGQLSVEVVNGGPDAVTIAQVMVDEAFWRFTVTPGPTVGRLRRATVDIPYPWVENEPHRVVLLTSTGLTFEHEIAVARETPALDAPFFGVFALIGLYVGVIPVALGLLWYPALRRLERRWLHFLLALTGGLLLFLGVDAVHEALESAADVAGAFQGPLLVLVGAVGALLLLQAVSASRTARNDVGGRRAVAWLVALGIGLHNLGEGLAIGAAYVMGEAALGAFLVIGFMLHNSTEGLAIVAPIARDRPRIAMLAGMGALAGVPTIFGAWIGGAAFSPALATLFLSIGAGAIAQVIVSLYRVVARASDQAPVWTPLTAGGLVTGMLVMYGTGLLVAG
jgi:zinc transporter, ZIP family